MPDLTWPQALSFLIFVGAALASVFHGVAHADDVVILAVVAMPLFLISDLALRVGRLYFYFRPADRADEGDQR